MRRCLRITAALLVAALVTAAQAQTFRDPMRPAGATPAAKRAAVSTLKLEGVIASPGVERVAIVNGRVVRIGDTVAGAQILEVLVDGVRYVRAGRIQTLTRPGVRPTATIRVARSPEAIKP